MIRVGIVGFGFMGRMHYRCWKALPGATVIAVCDADPHALQDEAKSRGNIAGAEGDVDLAQVNIHGDFSRMIREEQLDAVSITLPTHLHPGVTVAALEAGCHVLCEKPIALNLLEASRMVEAARRTGKVLQIGHCIRFWPEYAKAQEIVAGGTCGPVIAASFQRLAATAARKPQSWYLNDDLSGGMPLDLHIHDTDFIQYTFGMPRSVCSHGSPASATGLAHIATRYGYGDDKLVVAEGGWAMMPGFGFQMRFHIAMERGTLDFDFRRDPKLQLSTADGELVSPACEPQDGYTWQVDHFARCIRRENVPPVTSPEEAWNSLRIVEAERESVRTGREVLINDPATKEPCHEM